MIVKSSRSFEALQIHRQSHLVHPARGLEEGAVGPGAREAAWQQLAGGRPLLLVVLALAHGDPLLAAQGIGTH